jgi:SWI/SNF-related matrix-associated actin-dependent regulator 1 of chromatin subfamily A
VKLTYKTKPYPHQVAALRMLLRNGGGGLQVPMRWGKSWVGINFAAAMYLRHGMRRVLVITVTSGLGVWEDQVAAHCPVPWSTHVYGNKRELQWNFSKWDDTDRVSFLIVNFPNLYKRERDEKSREWLPVPNRYLADYDADIVIVDESHHIGDPSIVQSQEARRLGRTASARVFMTGSMFHRKPFFVFGQLRFYDDGATLGSSYTQYKKRIAVFGGFGDYEVLRYRNLRWMTRRLKPVVYMEKYVPPRNAVSNMLTFDLTGKNLEAYNDMHKSGVVTVYDCYKSLAPIVLTKHLRLQQICGGFLTYQGKGLVRTKRIGTDKLDVCADRLNEYMEQDITKAVIGCRFLPELAAVARIAKRLGFLPILFYGAVPKGDERKRRVALFQETTKPAVFISQIAAGKESIDLSAASVMMHYSLSESYVDHDQFSKRIEKYDEKRTLMYDFLIGNGTRDAVTLAALEIKRDVADFIVSEPERVEELATLENRKKVAA